MKMTKIKVGFQRGDDYLYSNSQLIQDNVKIEVKLASTKNDNYDEYDDFLGADTNILEKKSGDNSNNQGEKEDFNERIEAEVP